MQVYVWSGLRLLSDPGMGLRGLTWCIIAGPGVLLFLVRGEDSIDRIRKVQPSCYVVHGFLRLRFTSYWRGRGSAEMASQREGVHRV